MPNEKEHFVGIDVAKDWFDVAVLGEKRTKQVASTKKGIRDLVRWMSPLRPQLIVVEASGGYEEALVLALFEAGLPVALVSPQRVRQYARARGRLAKTDPLDAQLLAEYGQAIQPRLFVGKREERKQLSALVGRRNQLNALLQAEKNRRRGQTGVVRSSLEKVIACLEAELKQMDQEIQALLQEHSDLQSQENLLRSAKSIGRVTAPRSWRISPNWGNSIASRSLPWWESPPSTRIQARSVATAKPKAVAPLCAGPCIWPP
jgi:transposase